MPTEVDGTRAPKKTSPIVGSGILHTPPVCLSLQGATERAGRGRAHTDLKKSHEHLRNLAAHLQSASEEEKAHMAPPNPRRTWPKSSRFKNELITGSGKTVKTTGK